MRSTLAKFSLALLLLLGALSSADAHIRRGGGSGASPPPAGVFYISTTGVDTPAPTRGTFAAPFATWDYCRQQMDVNTTKICTGLGGTWNLVAPVANNATPSLTNGETFTCYAGRTCILDGGSTGSSDGTLYGFQFGGSVANHVDGVTWSYLTFKHFQRAGLYLQSSNGDTIYSNTFDTIYAQASPSNQGAITMLQHTLNAYVSNNLVLNGDFMGIMVNAHGASGLGTNNIIRNNIVHDVCKVTKDCGGIYVAADDTLTTGTKITNNLVYNVGNDISSKCIYDDFVISDVTIQNNICYGANGRFWQTNGGSNQKMTNNILDITSNTANATLLYGHFFNDGLPMTGNTFQCNLVYTSAAAPSALWQDSRGSFGGAAPTVTNNDYYRVGQPPNIPNTVFVDGSPITTDPGFTNAAANNYTLTGVGPTLTGCPVGSAFVNIVPPTAPLPH